MAKNSVSTRIHPSLDAKIKQIRTRASQMMGCKISYVQASEIAAERVRQ